MSDNYKVVPNGQDGSITRRSIETPANSGIYADAVVIVGADGSTAAAGGATAAKQDDIITKLNTIITDQLTLATSAKQDTQTTALGTLATAAKQDTQTTALGTLATAAKQDTLLASIGTPADTAWSGSGDGTMIAVLKAIWTKLP